VSDAAKSFVKAKAQKILDSIRAGGDFADFARRYSEDQGSAATGGDLGFARRGQLVKEFEEAVFSLKENQLADIVETSFGYHVIQLLDRRGESVHARHILFKIARDSAGIDSATSLLAALRDSAMHGADFAELAKKYSDDKESAPLGGLLGKFSIDQFDKSLQGVVKDLKEGDISAPVEVSTGPTTGFHIIFLKRRISEHTMNLSGDWKRVEQLATTSKQNGGYQKWLKQLRTEIYWDNRL
jgi:peptidyl-prolyl cis-trans isomerase SurA